MSGPTAPTAPRAPSKEPPGAVGKAAVRPMKVSRAPSTAGQKIVVYGPGGVGKTELCSLLKPLFVDVEDSARFLDVDRIDPTPETLDEVRAVLQDAALMEDRRAVVIDSLTKLEELATTWTVTNVKHEKGHTVSSVEGYGWGKGYAHVYETFLRVLGDLDAIARRGIHVIATCHDCTASVPNPGGEDWIRYEPRLQASKQGSIRHRVKEWCDHLLYLGFDQIVNTDGKATGSGTRTIYPAERPTHWAKSRLLSDPVPYPRGDDTIWKLLFKGNE